MQAIETPPVLLAALDEIIAGADRKSRKTVFTTEQPEHQCWIDDGLFIMTLGTRGFLKQVANFNEQFGCPLPGVVAVGAGSTGGSLNVTPHGGPLIIAGGGEITGDVAVVTVEPGSDVLIHGVRISTTATGKYLIRAAYIASWGAPLAFVADQLEHSFRASMKGP